MNEAMLCPTCHTELTERRLAHGIFWSCENCGGRALTIELLRRTFSPESINPLWLHAMQNEGAPGRACPLCARLMLAISLAGSAPEPTFLDVCKSCHLVWLDRGEVEALPQKDLPHATASLSPEQLAAVTKANADLMAEKVRAENYADVWKQIGRALDTPLPGWWGIL